MKSKQLGKRHGWLPGLILSYGGFLALITVVNWSGPDRWWIGALNLYLPQAVWLVPLLPLAILSWKFARRWVWAVGICGAWVCGPIMGFCWRLHEQVAPVAAEATLRLMTCNIKNGRRDVAALISEMGRYKPDVVCLQDVEKVMSGPLGGHFRGWNVRSYGQYVIASRWPLAKAEVRFISPPDEGEYVIRTVLQFGQTPISIYNVHLLTPRDGLNALRVARKQPGRFTEAVQDLRDNVERRILQAGRLSDIVRQERGATILAGDLNSPDESLACKSLRDANLHDAFAEGGRGYGYTYGHFLLHNRIPWLPGASWMRIDHIMLNHQVRSIRCWTGTNRASDHRPVYADLALSTP
jgi:endonuclease/exonuclease/phosphatase family metal-dependent hydrolase